MVFNVDLIVYIWRNLINDNYRVVLWMFYNLIVSVLIISDTSIDLSFGLWNWQEFMFNTIHSSIELWLIKYGQSKHVMVNYISFHQTYSSDFRWIWHDRVKTWRETRRTYCFINCIYCCYCVFSIYIWLIQ